MARPLVIMLSSLKYTGDNEGMIPVGPKVDMEEVDMEEVDVERASEEAADNAELVLMRTKSTREPVWLRSGLTWREFECEPKHGRR